MKNKIAIAIVVLLIAALLWWGYSAFLAPKGVEGEKEVAIQIVIESQEINETFTYHTDHEFLYDLLKEKEEELGARFQSFDFGVMVTGLMNYTADSSKEYFHVTINGEDAMSGSQEIPLIDGDVYKFELTGF